MTLWVLTAMFAATFAYHASRLLRSGGSGTRHAMHDGSHALMSAAMIMMLWFPVRSAITVAYVAVFGVLALWYVYTGTRPEPDGRRGHHLRSAAPWFDTAMMASMVWMAVAMGFMASAGADSTPLSGPDAHDPMLGMDHGGGAHSMAPAWVRIGCDIAAIGFFLAAIWVVAAGLWWTALGDEQRPSTWSVVSSSVMAAGMGIAFTQMAA